jgi:hypothetical protein
MSGLDDTYTKSLLHMDGANNGTTFMDESGKTWTAEGTAVTSTTSPKFGTADGLFDGGATCCVDTPAATDFNVGSGDFTIDFWFKKASNSSSQVAFGQSKSDGSNANISFWLSVDGDGANHPQGVVYIGGTGYSVLSTTAITDTNWHHYAFTRYGNYLHLYIDGTEVGTSANVTGLTVNSSTYKAAIGRPGEYAGSSFNGKIDEFRFTKGLARWTGNFTPPAVPYAPAFIQAGIPVACTPFMMI